jgi:hypothetical protein
VNPETCPHQLDDERIEMAATWAAHQLRDHNVARMELSPGDYTTYQILIAAPGMVWTDGNERMAVKYTVSLGFGDLYPWPGDEVHPAYAAQKWGRDNVCTGEVLARFLNALGPRLAAGSIDDCGTGSHEYIAENAIKEGVLMVCLHCPAEAIVAPDGTLTEEAP